MKIRAAIARRGERQFTLAECELDEPRENEVLIRVEACGLCHTDLSARDQHIRTPLPAVLGHEGVGRVLALGPGVSGFAVGERVLASFGACGSCTSCRQQSPAYCRHLARFCLLGQRVDGSSPTRYLGEAITGHFFGQSSFASHAVVATHNLVKLADDLPPALMAPLACGVQTGMSALVNVLQAGPGDTVAVLGCGGVGLAAVMAARIRGCAAIVAVDRVDERLALARELGATHAVKADELPALARTLHGLSHALDTTGHPALIQAVFDLLRPRGSLVCAGVGQPDAQLSFNHNALMLSGRSVRGTIEGDADPRRFIPQMIEWYRDGCLPLARLVRRYRFDDINEAIADMEAGRVVKPVLVMDPAEL